MPENLFEPARYSFLAKFLHWSFAALFLYGIFKQVGNVQDLEDSALLRFEIVFAILFLAILVIRFIYMRQTQQSSLPEETPKLQKIAAKFVHYGMYISLAVTAISGLLIGLFYSSGIKSGIIMDATIGIHSFTVTLAIWLVVIHILAALYHRFLKDGVWSAMVPIWKE